MNCLISILIYTISRRSFEYQKHVTVFNSPISTDSMPEKNNDKISGQIPEIPQIPFAFKFECNQLNDNAVDFGKR